MPKSKQPAPRKSSLSSSDEQDALTQKLCDLAIEIVEQEDSESMTDTLKKQASDFHKLIKKSVYQKKDDLLYTSLDRTRDADIGAYRFLRESIEEASEVLVTQGADGKNVEINAFLIPVFGRSTGGLHAEQCFQDQEAFELLTNSFNQAQLESPDATVLLISHAYHLDEIDAITYGHLNDMIREVLASMTEKKAAGTSAIERSFSGWPEHLFAPGDVAVELRFLLGFALKSTSDPFYRIPEDEAAVDAYFEARAERFQQWTEQVAPLVKRCLVNDGREIDLNFLYQDLFHGGKASGIAEYFMLQMLSELNQALDDHGIAPENTTAVIGPAEVRDDLVLRVNLHAEADGALVASAEKPLDAGRDPQVDIDDTCDALSTIGVTSLRVAVKFDEDGQAVDPQPYGH